MSAGYQRESILERQVTSLNECNIKDITLIRGYQKSAITLPNIKYYDNDNYEQTGELYSYFCAENEMKGRMVMLYGDIVFDTAVLQKLLKSPADIAIVVDLSWRDRNPQHRPNLYTSPDLVILEVPPGSTYRYVTPDGSNRVLKIGRNIPHEEAHGEFIGLAMCSAQGTDDLKKTYKELPLKTPGMVHESQSLEKASLTDLLQTLIDQGKTVECVPIYKGWLDVDSFEDYQKAWAEVRS